MRDIRADLKERLANAEAQRAQFQVLLKGIDVEVDALMRLLELEDARRLPSAGAKPQPTSPIKEFILALTGEQALSKEQIKASAINAGYEVDGRQIHAHVFNLVSLGTLERLGGDLFGKTSAAANIAAAAE